MLPRSRAKDLCPDLIVVPYMFDKYEETSEKVGTGCLRLHVPGNGSVVSIRACQPASQPWSVRCI